MKQHYQQVVGDFILPTKSVICVTKIKFLEIRAGDWILCMLIRWALHCKLRERIAESVIHTCNLAEEQGTLEEKQVSQPVDVHIPHLVFEVFFLFASFSGALRIWKNVVIFSEMQLDIILTSPAARLIDFLG